MKFTTVLNVVLVQALVEGLFFTDFLKVKDQILPKYIEAIKSNKDDFFGTALDIFLPNGLGYTQTVNKMTFPNIDDVKKNALYAAAALCPKETVEDWVCKSCTQVSNKNYLRNITFFENIKFSTGAYIAIKDNEKKIKLIFRGSSARENYIQALQFGGSFNEAKAYKDVKIHSGYLEYYESLEPLIIPKLTNFLNDPALKDYRLELIGHSLGGSMASIALVKLTEKQLVTEDRISLYTYGQPRTGNLAFVDLINSKAIASARVVNSTDIIPRAFLNEIFSLVHQSNELYLPAISQEIIACDRNVYEDPKCGASLPIWKTSIEAHLHYFGAVYVPKFGC